ncbi:hypothetical protein DRQ32_10870, partial [bacterium]
MPSVAMGHLLEVFFVVLNFITFFIHITHDTVFVFINFNAFVICFFFTGFFFANFFFSSFFCLRVCI